jgi:predicted O-linked N-acetylglucosamine transferase (SPINDLY family)
LRQGLRERMRASPLMDVSGFTRRLEQVLIELYRAL